MDHPIIEDLKWRHTAKKYDASKKVSAEDLAVLFEAMRLSASSINSQPWRFVVIESEEAKARMHGTFSKQFLYNQPHAFESSHIILFAHHPQYSREAYAKVVDKGIADKRIEPEKREAAFGSFAFAEKNTDAAGNTANWTKAQTYLALGNTLHVLARLRIDSTPLEGIDAPLVQAAFKEELGDYQCEVALAIGYHHPEEDYNAKLPKSRHDLEHILIRV